MKSYYLFLTLILGFSVLLAVDCIAQCPAPDMLGNRRWYGTSPQVLYLISTLNTPSYLNVNDVVSHIQAGASSWGMAGDRFDFLFNGTNQAVVDVDTPCAQQTDRRDLFGWGNEGPLYIRPEDGTLAGVLGNTLVDCTSGQGPSGRLLFEFIHAVLNYNIDDGSGSYKWSLNPPPPQPGNYQFDVQSIAAHEWGHWLMLIHPDENKYPSRPTMEVRRDLRNVAGTTYMRTLECEDIWGINNIYDGTSGAPPFFVSYIHHNTSNPNLTPGVSVLYQNIPNPANPETWIPFELSEDSDVTVRIYNAQGQLVRILALGRKEAGYYIEKPKAAYWDGRNDAGELVSSGVYFYQLQAGQFSSTRKMLILK